MQELDIDVFEHLKVVDYDDVKISPEASYEGTVESILEAQALVETRVRQVIAAGAIPVVIGQNSPVAS
ncbi:hypothetical protein [Sodalis praecaptivus]|uniref:hypothetical protein n=1 Tax=Sodalis praecaptivus TaxID=1239307 RepID=UPI0027EB56BC|nr:hypothetical protein [Sodalis praecaptivus]CAJ0995175.1 hypothetical protein NVIRENTERO_01785 [Sodalis praecaptivus]